MYPRYSWIIRYVIKNWLPSINRFQQGELLPQTTVTAKFFYISQSLHVLEEERIHYINYTDDRNCYLLFRCFAFCYCEDIGPN